MGKRRVTKMHTLLTKNSNWEILTKNLLLLKDKMG